jgi:radical SAM protein with 4Fe4S-binding SPASM domain
MKYLVIIDGPMAVGKTTITEEIQKRLNNFCFISPENYNMDFLFLNSDERRKLKKQLSFFLLRELIRLNQNILIDSMNFDTVVNKIESKVINEYYIIPIKLICSVKTAVERNVTRNKKANSLDVISSHSKFNRIMQNYFEIDTEELSIEQSTIKVLNLIQKKMEETNTYMPIKVIFFPTNKCNLHCIYCYSEAGENENILDLDINIGKRAIDLIINNALATNKNKIIIKYHGGGEPFLSFKFIKTITNYALNVAFDKGVKIKKISASTNGVLSSEQVQWIVENMTDIQVSIDGLPHIQNLQRPINGINGNSFDKVFNSLKYFDKHNFSYKIKTTVTAASVENLPKFIEYITKNTKCKKVHFEAISEFGRTVSNKLKAPSYNDLYSAWNKAKEIAMHNQIELYSSDFSNNYNKAKFCGATNDNFIITTDGLVTTCFKVSTLNSELSDIFIIGKYDNNCNQFQIEHEKIKYLKNLNYKPVECAQCPSYITCNNKCIADYLLTNNLDRKNKTNLNCDLRKIAAK